MNSRRDDLYDLSLDLVLLYEVPHVARSSTELRRLWRALRGLATMALARPDPAAPAVRLDRAAEARQNKSQALEVPIGDFGPTRLEKQDAFRFFRELVHYTPALVGSARIPFG